MKVCVLFLILASTGVCLAYSPVDLNFDGIIDYKDLTIMANQWLNSGSHTSNSADINLDGIVNNLDFSLFAKEWRIKSPIIYGTTNIGGVILKGLPGNIVSDKQGFYSVMLQYDWSGTVTPIKQGYIFNPGKKIYNSIITDIPNESYDGVEDPCAIYCEFNSDSNDFIVQRNSWGVQEVNTFVDVPPGKVRIETIGVTSMLTPSEFFNYKPKAVDSRRGIILCTDLLTNSEFQYKLYKTTDGVNFQQLLDIRDNLTEPFKTYYQAMNGSIGIWGLAVMDDGSWLMSIGSYDVFKGVDENETTKPSGRIYRLANPDDPHATWTMVCNMPFGYVPEWGWQNKTGPKIVVAEYGNRLQDNNPRCIFMSEDYGATWRRIYTPVAINGQHTHQAVFDPISDYKAIYVAAGDGQNIRNMYRLEKIGDVWIKTKDVGPYQPVGALVEGSSIYWGSDQDNMGASIMRHWRDGIVDKFEPLMRRPWPQDDPAQQPYRPYINASNKGFIFCIIKHDGVYYATMSEESTTAQSVAGIYVSADLKEWVCAYREFGQVGPLFIAGYCNGKIWGSSQETVGAYQQRQGFSFSPLKVKTVNAMKCQRGLTNQFSANDSTFSSNNKGGWKFYSDSDSLQSTTVNDIGLHGNSCLKFIHSGTTVQQGMAELRSPYITITPHIGDRITFSWWMKAADSWPAGYDVSASIGGAGNGTGIDYNGDWYMMVMPGAWRKYSLTAKVTANVSYPNICLRIYMHNHGYLPTTDAKLYIDCAQMVSLPDRFVPDTTFQIGGQPRDNEVLAFPLYDVGSTFTTIFEWHPETGYKNILADLPIAAWVGADGHGLSLNWDQTTTCMKLSDSNGSGIETTSTYPFLHNTFTRFALVSDPYGSIMYIQAPSSNMTVLGDGTVMKLTAPLNLLKLGTNLLQTDYGCGSFCNVRVWKRKLSLGEIKASFDQPDSMSSDN